MRWRCLISLAVLVLLFADHDAAWAQAFADVRINEIVNDVPGTDDLDEFIELRDVTNSSVALSGLSFLVIEGDGVATGTLDVALSLSGFTTNAGNGLFLWRASAAVPDGGLTGSSLNTVDFSPDLENGTNTFLLVANYDAGAAPIGTDLDTNNDGVLDVTPWSAVIDAIAVTDLGVADFMYAAGLGFTNATGLSFTPGTVFRRRDDLSWIATQTLAGTGSNPFPYDSADFATATGVSLNLADFDIQQTSSGSVNPALVAVPEPTTLALLGLVAGGMGVRLWRKHQKRERSQ